MPATNPLRVLLALIIPQGASALTPGNTRFVKFFPDFAQEFELIRDEQCDALWAIQQTKGYRTGDGNCNMLLSCILENTNEFIKANMASGTIALGLAPTILSILGSTTGETALLSKRRPLLAFLIGCGSVAVNPLPTFVYENPLEALKAREGRLAPSHVTGAPQWQLVLIVVAEYMLVLAAIVNEVSALYATGKWTVNTISCDTIYMPLLWAALTPGLHVLGMIALRLRTEVVLDGDREQNLGWSNTDLRTWLFNKARHEFSPCARHDKLKLQWKNETHLYVLVSWWASVCTATHLLFGTIVLSSLVFMGYVDSIKIIGRLMASVIVCRAILVFELAGMRNALFKHHAATNAPLGRGGFARLDGEDVTNIELHDVDLRAQVQALDGPRKHVQYTLGRAL